MRLCCSDSEPYLHMPYVQADDLKMTIAKLTREVAEREAVNTDNYHTIQALRRRVQDLEKHKFVLGYKVCSICTYVLHTL